VVIPESYPAAVPITAMAFSPDSTAIAASGYHEVNLWNVADGALSRRVLPLDERIYDVAYSPDGRWLATASGDPGQYGSAKLWLAEPNGGGKIVRDLAEATDCFFAVAFSPDSKLVAAAGADRAIRVWEAESGKLVLSIEDHADWIFDLAFSPDGKRLASASRDKTSKVFDVAKKESLVTFPGHAETVYTVAFSPDGKSVASGGADNQIRFWNPDDEGKQTRTVGGFGGAVFRLQFLPDGKELVACSADKNLRVIDPSNGSTKRTFSGHRDWVYSFCISADAKTLASGSWDGEIRLWTLADAKPGLIFLAAPGMKLKTEGQAAKRTG
jgi:WD40 repeat protein